jgi:phospholipid/cholesterol/gamma-HCH transport system substrate-binding protein
MKLTIGKTIRLILFIVIGLGIFGYAIYTIGKQSNLFGNTFTITGIFKDVSGLKIGNNARFSGINVGTVSDIKIINDTLVQVEITVEEKVRKFIRKDSRMEIRTEGLMGNKVVNILPGSTQSPTIEEGDELQTIEAIEIDQIMEELKKSSENTTVVTRNLAEITEKINKGEGIFGKLFTDTTFTNNLDQISYNTAKMTNTLSQITSKIDREEGVVGKMLSDTSLAKNFDEAGQNLLKSTKNLERFTSKINQGEGIFGKMYTDTGFIKSVDDISANLDYTSRKTKELMDKLLTITGEIEGGKGLVNKLLTDSVFADSVQKTLHNIDKTVKELEEASETVRKNWFIRTFSSKKKEKSDLKKEKENQKNK